MKLEELQNLYLATTNECSKFSATKALKERRVELDEIEKMTVVYFRTPFSTQSYEEEKPEGIFFVQKYDQLLLEKDFINFVLSHNNEDFLLLYDGYGDATYIRAFVESKENDLRVTFFGNYNGTGHLHKIAQIKNKFGTAEFEEPETFDKQITINMERNSFEIKIDKLPSRDSYYSDYQRVREFLVFNAEDRKLNLKTIMNNNLQLPGQTRILVEEGYGCYISFVVETGERATASTTERYGLNKDEFHSYYGGSGTSYFHEDDVFTGPNLSPETMERITNHITTILKNGGGVKEKFNRYSYDGTPVMTYSMIVIDNPIDSTNKRRPTYHWIKGFYNVGAIDIVELMRGELLIKDMTPINAYYLNAKNGKYCKISHALFGNIKSMMMDNDLVVDPVSLQEWTEEKSLHPELLKAIADYSARTGDKIDLLKIKLFNRIPFGSLFLEQLIKCDYAKLSIELAELITERADNMNYVCSNLGDILPDCKPEETSLGKVLNMSKPCYDLLFNESKTGTKQLNSFLTAYKAIRVFVPDGVLNKERQKLIQYYTELTNMDLNEYSCGTGRKLDIINYPEEIKSIYKMINKINNFFTPDSYNMREARRHYEEILGAYFQFKDFGWDPSSYLIFIEFGISGSEKEALDELDSREKAANEALKIYKNKIDEAIRNRKEQQYEYRKKALSKLESNKTEKTTLSKIYSVIMPSQIYGEEVVGSIEKEGNDMDHCVYRSYANDIAEGKYTVLYLRRKMRPEESLVTIGITREGRINQTFTFHDHSIDEQQAQAIVEWAKSKKGLVTFKSEHKDVQPGGWCRSVEIPDLPVPDPNWLAKLAKISD